MKKVIFLVAVMLLVVSTGSFAQAKFGLKAGLNIANMGGDDMEDTDSRLAPVFGAFVNFSLSEKVSFQPELLYSMKGAKDSYTDSYEGVDVDIDETARLDYLDIPLMFKFDVGGGFNLQAGPQLGLLLSAEIEQEGSSSVEGMNISASETIDVKDDLKGMDLGLNIGAGYDFGALGVDLRYNLGLSNIADYEDGDLKNSAIQVGVSYAF